MSKEYFDNWTKRFDHVMPAYENHPREDYHLQSETLPIFVVADGVTLKRDAAGNYPIPSGAFEVAKIFCEAVMEEAEKRYEAFGEHDLVEVFCIGNEAARRFNDSKCINKDTINYRDFDFFSATTAFVLIKDKTAYWWSLCDSGVAAFDAEGNMLFQSPPDWPERQQAKDRIRLTHPDESELNKQLRRAYRNMIDSEGGSIGYGVVTGEKEAEAYLHRGSFKIDPAIVILVYTDGYEDYVGVPEFIRILNQWPEDLADKLDAYMESKNAEDIKFGRERSLFAIKA